MITVLQEFWARVGMLRCPVGLMLFKAEQLGMLAEVAARCSANIADFRQFARQWMGGSRYTGFTPDTLLAILREIQNSGHPRKCIVSNLDLAIARLRLADRTRFWSALVSQVTPNSKTTIALSMPDEETAMHLLPPANTLKEWIDTGRALRISPPPLSRAILSPETRSEAYADQRTH